MGIVDEALDGGGLSIVDEALTPVKKKPGIMDKVKDALSEGIRASSAESDMMFRPEIAPALESVAAGAAAFPVAGIAGLSRLISTGDLGEANKTIEGISSFIPEKILKTDQERDTAAVLGEGLTKPFTMAGEGLKEIVKLTPLEGTVAEPIAGTVGEASAMFGLPGILKRGKAKPSIVDEALPEASRIKNVDVIEQAAKVEPKKGGIVDEALQTEVKPQPDLSGLISETRKAEQAGELSWRKTEAKEPLVKFDGEIEERFKAAQGQGAEPVLQRFKNYMVDIGHKMSRPYENLPKTGEFAEAQFALKKLEKQGDVTGQRAILEKANELQGLDKADYDLFTRKVVLDDLLNVADKGRALPFGFTPETLKAAAGKVDSFVSQNPKVLAALEKRKASWDNLKSEYIGAMKDIGFDVADRFTNENYFRHQVLEYANAKGIYGTGKKLKTPTGRGFLKKREGSTKDINTDYLEAEFEVYGQMLRDIETARTIKRIDQNYNIADKVRADARAKGLQDWRQAIPEGYTTWQPREGNVFYFSDSIPAKIAEQLYSGAFEEVGITKDMVKKVMTMGQKRREFVIKNELAATLDELQKTKSESVLAEGSRNIQKAWKVWQLISPRRFVKYNLRNITGDADASMVGNPSGFAKVPQAVRELYDVYVGKKPMTPEMAEYFDRGGLSATLQAQEIGDLKKLWVFKKLYPEGESVANLPKKGWEKYWKAARMSTDFREGILRYANYLDFLEQMKKSPDGRPKSFGASIPDEIMGLKDVRDRAFWLSNDLLGAYDRVSVFGQVMREHVFPFWSWKEVNFKRYKQFIKNAIDEGTAPAELAKRFVGSAAIKSPYVAYRVGSFLMKATALSTMLATWNNLMFPEEEKALSQDIKKSTHIVLGRDPKTGEILYFNRLGALGDILEWFGLDAAPKTVDKWLRGKATLQEAALEMAKDSGKAPLNVVASGSFPFTKLGLETATRRSTFPDVTSPTTIRDRGLHLARSFGLDNEYRELAGLPSMGYGKSLGKVAFYSVDPLEGSYRDIFELKSEFLKKQGKSSEGFWLTPKGDALYNLRLALRYGDKTAVDKYMAEYANLGGTSKGIIQSLKMMDPLSGMNAADRNAFISTLDKADQQKLTRAYQFFQTVLLGSK
ncbi:MAG: hypothetical protein ACE14T_10465 [Syntrophales bacterium]